MTGTRLWIQRAGLAFVLLASVMGTAAEPFDEGGCEALTFASILAGDPGADDDRRLQLARAMLLQPHCVEISGTLVGATTLAGEAIFGQPTPGHGPRQFEAINDSSAHSPLPPPRDAVERLLDALIRAWNGLDFGDFLDDAFPDRERLLAELAERPPAAAARLVAVGPIQPLDERWDGAIRIVRVLVEVRVETRQSGAEVADGIGRHELVLSVMSRVP
ncbi:hypothetical protein J2T57_004027 [Natronocella acetinitrilica]|uniref:Uncharacterized protein n=1 Tax=Natronocella acetinitrilica TaxID=414046 RepID=A0AAE3G734_9GAMM|nr:hypothetical protein [Natronocella acetinitrilica]MCP1676854.1 hypothetical protein [Natronocella acetinitrilica]